jgi:hypothetical protein
MTPTPTPVPICPETGPFNVLCFQVSGISGVIGAIITLIFVIAVAVALFYLLFGAAKWINSGGDKALVEGARGQIVGAAVGLVILFVTFLVINVLFGFFKIDIGAIVIPKLNKIL